MALYGDQEGQLFRVCTSPRRQMHLEKICSKDLSKDIFVPVSKELLQCQQCRWIDLCSGYYADSSDLYSCYSTDGIWLEDRYNCCCVIVWSHSCEAYKLRKSFSTCLSGRNYELWG